MKTSLLFTLFLTTAILVACNRGSENGIEVSPEKQGVDVPAFQGNWRSDTCNVWGGGNFQYSGRLHITIKGSSLETYSKDYNTNDCTGDVRSILKMKMKYDLSGEETSGWYKIDVVASGIYQTVFDQDAANVFNTSAYCGYTDWIVGVEKEISDRDCMSGVKTNQTVFSQVRITNTEIQLADEDDVNDGSTPEKRHKTPGAILKKSNGENL